MISAFLALAAVGYTLPTRSPAATMAQKMSAAPTTSNANTKYAKLWCEDEYNAATGEAEEVCYVPPHQAEQNDMDSCMLLGDYGAGTRWAVRGGGGALTPQNIMLTPSLLFFGLCYCTSQCTERMGANAEEEEINGKTMWVHYVR